MANQHIKLPCTTPGLQCLCLPKISTFQNLHICRFDLIRISPSCEIEERLVEMQTKKT